MGCRSVNLLERIDFFSHRTPDTVAHTSPSGTLTYAELASGSDAVAAWIQHTLPNDTAPVVIVGHKEPEMLLGFLGSVKAGHSYVPLDTAKPGS